MSDLGNTVRILELVDRKLEAEVEQFALKLGELLLKSITHSFCIERHGEQILSVPFLIMLVAAAALFRIVTFALLVGLFLDCRYFIEERKSKS